MKKPKVKWKVKLNNNKTYYEDKGKFKIINNELSAWERLKKFIKRENLKIEFLSLYTDDGREFNFSQGNNCPQFNDFKIKPNSYNFFRKKSFQINMKHNKVKNDHFTVMQAVYNKVMIELWVNEDNPNISWITIKIKRNL